MAVRSQALVPLWKRGEGFFLACRVEQVRTNSEHLPILFPLACLAPLRGTQLAVMPYRHQSSAQPPATVPGSMPPATTGGRVSNAVEYVVTKVDDLVNYARKVSGCVYQRDSIFKPAILMEVLWVGTCDS